MKHTARLTVCLLALALTACTAAPQDMPAGTTTGHAYAPLHDLGRGGGAGCRLQRDEH